MLAFLLNLLVTLAGILLGGYILVFGRRALSVTLGIVALAVAANVLSLFVAGGERGRDLVALQEWGLIAAAVVIGAIGFVVGRYKRDWAAGAIGFIAGANVTLWLLAVASYGVTAVISSAQVSSVWVGLALLVAGGIAGILLVQWERDEALIILTVLVGVEVIRDAIGLDGSWTLTAIVTLGLALAGVLLQYAFYLRESKDSSVLGSAEPMATGLAYFQDLDLG